MFVVDGLFAIVVYDDVFYFVHDCECIFFVCRSPESFSLILFLFFPFTSRLVEGTSHISPIVCVWSFYLDKQAVCFPFKAHLSDNWTALLRPSRMAKRSINSPCASISTSKQPKPGLLRSIALECLGEGMLLLLAVVQGRGENKNSNRRSLHAPSATAFFDQADKTKEHPSYRRFRCQLFIFPFFVLIAGIITEMRAKPTKKRVNKQATTSVVYFLRGEAIAIEIVRCYCPILTAWRLSYPEERPRRFDLYHPLSPARNLRGNDDETVTGPPWNQ